MPDPLLYLQAMGAAATASMIILLAILAVRPPAGTTRGNTAAVLGMGSGLVAGYSALALQLAWPPAGSLDRLLTIIIPMAVGIELMAGIHRFPRVVGWLLRVCLAAISPRILLHGSVYLRGADRDWALWQVHAAMIVSGALLVGLWGALSWLSRRSSGVSIPLSLALATQSAGVTVMLAGYLKGGAAALPLVSALAATALGIRVAARRFQNPSNVDMTAIIGIGAVGLFGVLFVGRFFGRLSTPCAVSILLAPLLCWVTEAPVLRQRAPWIVGSVRLGLVAIPLLIILALAKVAFDRDMGPLL